MAIPPAGVRKGAWTEEEDSLLRKCIDKNGEGKWHQVPLKAGLNRCRKSCRLRWLNYLRPDIKRGDFAPDEDHLIIRLHKLLGNRWSLISGRLPGRTANDVKNHWNTNLQKKVRSSREEDQNSKTNKTTILKPRPRTLKNVAPFSASEKPKTQQNLSTTYQNSDDNPSLSSSSSKPIEDACTQWWSKFLDSTEIDDDMLIEARPINGTCLEFKEDGNGWDDFSLIDMDILGILSCENNSMIN